MKRKAMFGAIGGLAAGVALTAIVAGTPSWAKNEDQSRAPAASPVLAQTTGWGAVPRLADLVEQVSPSVVQVLVRSPAGGVVGQGAVPDAFRGTPFEDFFGRQFGSPGAPSRELPDRMGSGSGFFIGDGFIVTNNHVVDDAKKVTVKLVDGREIDAEVVGTDAKTDLAVLKVKDAVDVRSLEWGDSDAARPGDSIFAVGAPFGLGNTVTSGIVSARGRNINAGPYDDFIQVDAPINQGNSGGPLFNAEGRVIGVNSAIYSPSGGNVGIGFSIPSSLARSIVRQIIETGSVQRGWLGVQIQPVTPDMAKGLNLREPKGAIVAEVTDASPAMRAGFRTGDVILSFGDKPIAEVDDLTRAVADTKAGSMRDVRVLRGGREQVLKVKIEALEEGSVRTAALSGSNSPSASPAGRVALADLGLQLASEGGAVIADVKVNSPAADVGLRVGDKIVMVNQVETKSTAEVVKAIEEARRQKREAVLLQIDRGGQKQFVGVPFQS
jgi:serine protease Do